MRFVHMLKNTSRESVNVAGLPSPRRHVFSGSFMRLTLILMTCLSCALVVGDKVEENSSVGSTSSEGDTERVFVSSQLGHIRGLRQNGTLHFRGVPYAQPPVGELRFEAPRKPEGSTGILDATQFPNRCVQAPAGIFGQAIGATSEDCLYLNIVTPSTDGSHRPVMFWIHGGGFTQGSANGYDGSMLAVQGDVVVVTINYRLGIFGYLDLSTFGNDFAGSANNGMRDQVLALEWVRDNIADFGGNPENVTIFGESAGGASVLTLLATPSADGLFHKAIAHSPGTTDTPPANHVNGLLEHLSTTKDLVVDKLNSMSAEELFALQEALGDFGAAIDGTVVTRSPNEAIRERGAQGVPLIAGTNRDEGTFFSALFALFAPNAASEFLDGMARAVTAGADPQPLLDALRAEYPSADDLKILERVFDAMFLKAALGSATQATLAGNGGWLYRFDYATTKPVFGKSVGATHAAEIPFTFNRFNSPDPGELIGYDPKDAVASELAQKWSDTLIAFARTGNPNGAGLPKWPHYDAETRATLVLDAMPRIDHDLNRNLRGLWEKVLAENPD
ncbi:MAG: carboxylesterase/lipase family protein [Gammaproteobacteria bacterium]|nr:carboxylesterase/lipase family protein [Gammaproteobacteria bacterium]